MQEWIEDDLPLQHIFDNSDVAKIGRDYFKREAVEQRCRELKLLIGMGALDACHLFLLEILCPHQDDYRIK